jgi:hypothetical protein
MRVAMIESSLMEWLRNETVARIGLRGTAVLITKKRWLWRSYARRLSSGGLDLRHTGAGNSLNVQRERRSSAVLVLAIEGRAAVCFACQHCGAPIVSGTFASVDDLKSCVCDRCRSKSVQASVPKKSWQFWKK